MATDNAKTRVDDKSIADIVVEVSEKASLLVREEIELAKAEVEQKVKQIARGAVIAAAAAFFILLALIVAIEAAAWGINEALDYNHFWMGFLITAGGLVLLAIISAFIGIRSLSSGAPPMPEKAIEEAKLIREAIERPEIEIPPAGATTEGNR